MNSKSNRQKIQERQRKQKLRTNLIWGGLGVVALAIISFIIWQGVRPAAGEPVQVMVSDPHIPVDSDPGQYNSDPPTSGPHWTDRSDQIRSRGRVTAGARPDAAGCEGRASRER